MVASALPGSAVAHVSVLARLAQRRRMIETGQVIVDAGYNGAEVDTVGMVAELAADRKPGNGGLTVMGLAELAHAVALAPVPRYLVRSVVAEGDHGMVSAEFKAGKTWFVTDLAVSVSSGTPLLGIYPVDTSGPVLLFAGEGGARKAPAPVPCRVRGPRPGPRVAARACLPARAPSHQ